MSQINQIRQILSDNRPHRFDEIQEKMFGSTKYGAFRLGARVWDLNHKQNFRIVGWKDRENPALYWYVHIPFEWQHLYDEEIKLGHNEREAYYATRQKIEEQKAEVNQLSFI